MLSGTEPGKKVSQDKQYVSQRTVSASVPLRVDEDTIMESRRKLLQHDGEHCGVVKSVDRNECSKRYEGRDLIAHSVLAKYFPHIETLLTFALASVRGTEFSAKNSLHVLRSARLRETNTSE